MKRFVLLLIVLFSLLGAVGCMNQNDISKTDVDKPTSVPTTVVTENEPKENFNAHIKAETQSGTENKTDNNVQDISAFIPAGWHVLEKNGRELAAAEGDLNKDGIIDKAVVIESDTQPKESEDPGGPPRALLIAFKNKDNTYSLSIKADNAIMLRDQGGPFGDPFEDIKIERGSILLKFYGGSSTKWYYNYRFRFQDEGWFLIGATLGGSFTGTDEMVYVDEEDYNLLTGDYIIQKYDEKGELSTSKGNRGKRKLLNLKDFVAGTDASKF